MDSRERPSPGVRSTYLRTVREIAGNEAVRTAERVLCAEWEATLISGENTSEEALAARLTLVGLAEERVREAQLAGDLGELAAAQSGLEAAELAAERDRATAEQFREAVQDEKEILVRAAREREAWRRADHVRLADVASALSRLEAGEP